MSNLNLTKDLKKFEAEYTISKNDDKTYKWIFFEHNLEKATRYIKRCLKDEYKSPKLLKIEEF